MKIGRNETCPCGSGKKYKKCCMEKDIAEQKLYKFKCNFCGIPLKEEQVLAKDTKFIGYGDEFSDDMMEITLDYCSVDCEKAAGLREHAEMGMELEEAVEHLMEAHGYTEEDIRMGFARLEEKLSGE